MIELRADSLVVSFPEVHRDAVMTIEFQRTLRIPDDDRTYFLPPGLGRFPLRHVDDFAERVPEIWSRHGGVMLPMYQSEAMWLNFSSRRGYPFAVKVATGKISALTGKPWRDGLSRRPQDHVVIPDQPWLDGYVVDEGVIRQFVAMPLRSGYTVEEQLTGEGVYGGLQLMIYPLKREAWERRSQRLLRAEMVSEMPVAMLAEAAGPDMGLAPGGRMRQTIYEDEYGEREWDLAHSSRCFVHLANSMVWRSITGADPPTVPPTSEEYTRAGLPWFDYYAEGKIAVGASDSLRAVKGVAQVGKEKGQVPLPENHPVHAEKVVSLSPRRSAFVVREGSF